MTDLRDDITNALASHGMDWRINFNGLPYRHEFFCSCGAVGYEYEDTHRAEVAIQTIITWLEANEPQTDVGYESDGEDDLAWEWANGFGTGTEAVISLLRKHLTPALPPV